MPANCGNLSLRFEFDNEVCANCKWINVAFTLNGFDDQERNLSFAKTDFQVI